MVLGNLVAMQYGSAVVYPAEGFDPAESLKAVTEEKCTAFYGVPTMYVATLKELAAERNKYNVSSLRTGLMSGSVCPEPLIRRVFDELNMHGLCIVYGMTELSPVATLMGPSAPFEKKVTTVGRIGPMSEMKLIDEDGKIVPRGQEGEVCVRGYLVMKEYWGDKK
jgi:fatty-acyl-CoA synthase